MRQSTSDVVSVIGADGTVRYVSPNVERVFGYRPQELVGTLPVHHVHREDRTLVQNGARKYLALEHPNPRIIRQRTYSFLCAYLVL
jgi:PAS domain S-box-containing protein